MDEYDEINKLMKINTVYRLNKKGAERLCSTPFYITYGVIIISCSYVPCVLSASVLALFAKLRA